VKKNGMDLGQMEVLIGIDLTHQLEIKFKNQKKEEKMMVFSLSTSVISVDYLLMFNSV